MAATSGVGIDARSGTLTFLFTDLAGSTRLWERHPKAMTRALERHDAILRTAIEANGGHVVKTTGDGMMAVFGSAADGIAAGLAAQLGLASERWGATGPLQVRMGLHAGEVERRDGDYFGPTVNRTARIMAAGHGGQVLLSASAAALAIDRLPAGLTLRDLGEHRLKDLGRPERVFQVEHRDLTSTFPPLLSLGSGAANLPAATAAFVGRGAELREIGRRLAEDSVRLLTLTGPGGTGKTSLAIRAAAQQVEHFPDGVHFVDLSASRDADSFLVTVARAIGINETIERPLLDELHDRIRDRRMLLVLDNLEQVAGAAAVVTQLLADCVGLALLVTSREALRIRAEQVLPVPPMGVPPRGDKRPTAADIGGFEAVELFVERARAVRPGFELTDDNAPAIAEICLRLDGLPLAIELAAARLRLLSPDALKDRLGSRLELLRSATSDAPARQQTLRATIEWSYLLLDPGEQRLFALLAVFTDADVDAVESVAAASASDAGQTDRSESPRTDAIDGLASLLDKSLIRQVGGPQGEPRFAMLETIREYASERLAERPEARARVERAHASHFAAFAARQRPELIGAARDRALAAMTAEVGNLRIAWRYWTAAGELDQLDKLAEAILILNDARGWYLATVSLTTDLLTVLGTRRSAPGRTGQEITLRTTLARALMATRGYTPEVEEALERVLELFEGREDDQEPGTEARQHYAVLRGLSNVYTLRTEFEKSIRLGERIIHFAELQGDAEMLIDGNLVVGSSRMFMGDLHGGLRHLEEAIDSFGSSPIRAHHRFGNHPRVACLTTSALGLLLAGSPDRAAGRTDRAVALSDELGHPFTSAFARFHSALLHLLRSEPEIALERALATLAIADEHEFAIWTAVGSCLLGAAQTGLGRLDEGLAEIQRGMDMYEGARTPPVFWPMLRYVDAGASLRAGRIDRGLASIDQAIALMGQRPGSMLQPEFYLLKGDLIAAATGSGGELGGGEPGGPGGPAPWYRSALDEARDLDTRMTQLRAAVRLRRLAQTGSGDGIEAADDVLRTVLETFTEGFETPDLREAQALLSTSQPTIARGPGDSADDARRPAMSGGS